MTIVALEIRKVGRSYAICAGTCVLRRFRSKAQATTDLAGNRSFYEYWAGSAGVSIANTKPVDVCV